jgi:hypothetical protein
MKKEKIKITDHLGNEFNSKKDMCKAYNIDYNTYNSGWTWLGSGKSFNF